MLVKVEVFVEVPIDADHNESREGQYTDLDAQWDTMNEIAWHLHDCPGLRKIRMPDSPEPDITGTLTFDNAVEEDY